MSGVQDPEQRNAAAHPQNPVTPQNPATLQNPATPQNPATLQNPATPQTTWGHPAQCAQKAMSPI
ncbi:hypothetical protein DW690_23540 [Dorea longicatena]|nr:hypothetical protein DW690_23540 [Dorea longicatena]